MINYFIENGYTTNRWLFRYLRFVDLFKLNDPIKNKTHNHHILPKSIFPEFKSLSVNKFNKVILTHRAHLIAHYMLAKALNGNMWFAYNSMNSHNHKLSSILFENAQHELSSALSINYHSKTLEEKKEINLKISESKKGQIHSQNTKNIISSLKIERDKINGSISLSEETKEKISDKLSVFYTTNAHHTKGKTYEEIMGKEKADRLKQSKRDKIVSEETRKKISAIHKGKVLSETTKELMRSKIPITKDGKNKRINSELLERYLSEGWLKGSTQKAEEKFECPHCHKITNKGNLKRWHGDNCKAKLS